MTTKKILSKALSELITQNSVNLLLQNLPDIENDHGLISRIYGAKNKQIDEAIKNYSLNSDFSNSKISSLKAQKVLNILNEAECLDN